MVLKRLLRWSLGARAPHTDGTLRQTGLDGPVVIRRDAHGVAYVEAQSTHDAFFGLGFCQGQDRAFQIELLVRAARGTLAALVGREMLPVDQLSRRVGFAHIGRAQLAAHPPDVRARLEAFARGVQSGRTTGLPKPPHELAILRGEPTVYDPSDVFAVTQFMAFALSSNWDAELARLRILLDDGPEALMDLDAADPAWLDDHGASRLQGDVGILRAAGALAASSEATARLTGRASGSNAWVLSPKKTATGRAMLVCDPHLGPGLPAPWYLCHLRTPAWAMSGAFFVTQPMPSFGHNERVAWGITAGHVDNTDLFLERFSDDGSCVAEGDRWVPYDMREERIEVRGGAAVIERVRVTARGPVVSPSLGGEGVSLSLRGSWMAHRPMGVFGLYEATDCATAQAMMASHPAVSENRMFADVEGHIAWHMAGDTPVRKRGHGTLPMPGWDPTVGWHDAPLPYDQLPSASDPACGFLVSANNRPAQPPDGPFLSADWLDAHRHDRIVERLTAHDRWTLQESLAMHLDRTSVLWREVRGPLRAALAGDEDPRGRKALALLAHWDGVVSPDSAAASVYALLWAAIARRVVAERAPKSSRWALGEGTHAVLPRGMMPLRRNSHLARLLNAQPPRWFGARSWAEMIREEAHKTIDALTERHGPAEGGWTWGVVRPMTLLHPFGTVGPLGTIWNLGPLPVGGDGATIPQASVDYRDPFGPPTGVSNMRLAIDVGRWGDSRWSLAGGQSGNPLSAHYADLLPLWARGEGISIAWTREAVASAAVSTLRLQP